MSEKMLSSLPVFTEVTDAHEILTWVGNNAAGRITIASLINLIGKGIVAESLSEASGYVQFANGLKIQYGHVNIPLADTKYNFDFPISFLSVSRVCLIVGYTGMSYRKFGSMLNSPSNFAIQCDTADTNNVPWIAIGI